MLGDALAKWLNTEMHDHNYILCDYDRLSSEIRPCDVLLVEGRTRVSRLTKALTHSIWTHSAIYIGRVSEIKNEELRKRVMTCYSAESNEQLLVEPLLGQGTIVSPLSKYRHEHVRICRPNGLSRTDMQGVIRHVIDHLGLDYDVRQLLDLARYAFPFRIISRRWRSTLFDHRPGIPDKTVCSSMIASAFATVQYPIRPVVHRQSDGGVRMYNRNSRMYVPRDFDTSPYFDILKYPYPAPDNPSLYRHLPWDNTGMICNGDNECFIPVAHSLAVRQSRDAK